MVETRVPIYLYIKYLSNYRYIVKDLYSTIPLPPTTQHPFIVSYYSFIYFPNILSGTDVIGSTGVDSRRHANVYFHKGRTFVRVKTKSESQGDSRNIWSWTSGTQSTICNLSIRCGWGGVETLKFFYQKMSKLA